MVAEVMSTFGATALGNDDSLPCTANSVPLPRTPKKVTDGTIASSSLDKDAWAVTKSKVRRV